MARIGSSWICRDRSAGFLPFAGLAMCARTAGMVPLPRVALPPDQRLEFDIAGGPLGPVLLEIAQTGGAVVSFHPEIVERRQAPASRGAYTLLEALRLATQPSGLTVEATTVGALTITEPPAAPAAATPGAASVPQGDAAAVLPREVLLQDQLRYGNLRVRLGAQAARVPDYGVGAQGSVSVGTGRRAINWEAGVLYRLSPSASAYAGSQYAVETDIIRVVGPAIFDGAGDPTRTQQFQAGLKLDLLDDSLALTLEAYRTDQVNVPSAPAFGAPNAPNTFFFITPRRVVDGLEIDLAGRAGPALDVQLGLSFMRANDKRPARSGSGPDVYVPAGAIPSRAMHLLSRYRLPGQWAAHTSLGLGFRARSSSFAVSPNPTQPGLQLVLPGGAQLDLSLERVFGPWAVNAFVQNVFDRQLYETQSSPGAIALEPRRSFGLTATYKSPGLGP